MPGDKVIQVQNEVQEATNRAQQAMQLLQNRQERLEAIDMKATRLEETASTFHKKANELHCHFVRHAFRVFLSMLALLLIILIIVWVAGGFST